MPQINRRDALVGDDLLDRALREDPAEMQHGDLSGHLADKAHIVLDRENGNALGVQGLDDLAGGKALPNMVSGGYESDRVQWRFDCASDQGYDFANNKRRE